MLAIAYRQVPRYVTYVGDSIQAGAKTRNAVKYPASLRFKLITTVNIKTTVF
jgi:hypothetical protein